MIPVSNDELKKVNREKKTNQKSVRPNFWNVKPTFDWGMDNPCPYIWFGWWLITFDPFDISYMPDQKGFL